MTGTATTYALALGTLLYSAWGVAQAQQSPYPITTAQRATAEQVSQQGVPLSALAPNAPDSYTVVPGDTLWRISGLFLRQPWRWPELWGMNLQAIANPHLIYPGQVLYLERVGGYARLSTQPGSTIKLSPRVRIEDLALPTIPMHLIEPFLTEPLVVNSDTLAQAPRIIAGEDERLMLSQGDRAYARTPEGAPLLREKGGNHTYRLFRQATPIKDPITQEVLGYEAQFLGQAQLVRGETPLQEHADALANATTHVAKASHVPATVHIERIKEEIRAGDRLLPEPPRQFNNFVPQAPASEVTAHVASLYGSTSVRFSAQHQVVAINKGSQDGMAPGMVLAIYSKGRTVVDTTDARRPTVQLPDEENGLAMVFRSFDRVSYALIMDIQRGVQVGDRLGTPR